MINKKTITILPFSQVYFFTKKLGATFYIEPLCEKVWTIVPKVSTILHTREFGRDGKFSA